eukprot:Sspe_Gene.20430::Locus_7496_Transcript_1_1_Confidence_1.000_Length_1780::g.20430::m.20430
MSTSSTSSDTKEGRRFHHNLPDVNPEYYAALPAPPRYDPEELSSFFEALKGACEQWGEQSKAPPPEGAPLGWNERLQQHLTGDGSSLLIAGSQQQQALQDALESFQTEFRAAAKKAAQEVKEGGGEVVTGAMRIVKDLGVYSWGTSRRGAGVVLRSASHAMNSIIGLGLPSLRTLAHAFVQMWDGEVALVTALCPLASGHCENAMSAAVKGQIDLLGPPVTPYLGMDGRWYILDTTPLHSISEGRVAPPLMAHSEIAQALPGISEELLEMVDDQEKGTVKRNPLPHPELLVEIFQGTGAGIRHLGMLAAYLVENAEGTPLDLLLDAIHCEVASRTAKRLVLGEQDSGIDRTAAANRLVQMLLVKGHAVWDEVMVPRADAAFPGFSWVSLRDRVQSHPVPFVHRLCSLLGVVLSAETIRELPAVTMRTSAAVRFHAYLAAGPDLLGGQADGGVAAAIRTAAKHLSQGEHQNARDTLQALLDSTDLADYHRVLVLEMLAGVVKTTPVSGKAAALAAARESGDIHVLSLELKLRGGLVEKPGDLEWVDVARHLARAAVAVPRMGDTEEEEEEEEE